MTPNNPMHPVIAAASPAAIQAMRSARANLPA